ncbi:MAG: hypothetical protein IIA83_00075 [Thaumarchaeota archaeon]|nr:hypothetical protein [Nitrososphaerota archaeon]
MINKKQIILDRFVTNISDSKIKQFCKLLEENEIKLLNSFFTIKKILYIDSREEKYFLELLSNFTNHEDLILLIRSTIKIIEIKNELKTRTALVWTGPIKFHKKISQTYSNFLKMIEDSKDSIIFVGYAMTDKENKEIFDAFKKAAKERDVDIKIIFDKATKAKKWGKWTKSPKNIIAKLWGDIDHYPEIYSYDDKNSSLHAKFLIIDEKEILVTSANMTDRAMTRNLEMGIRHRGKIAKDAADLIELLIKKKIISEIKYD